MFTNKFKLYILAAGALTVIAVLRIAATYRATSQGFDEPCHVAAAIEFLDKGTYTLDPVHPPLSRIAIGLPLYLAGERFPKWSESDPRIRNYNEVGNSVLYGDGHYLRNLSLARAAVLPFFIICAAIVFLWTRREFGNSAALIAVMFFTTVPTVLAFAGLAYSDMTTACMQAAAIFAYVIWMERPSLRSTVLLGIAVGLALASKLTSVLFLFSAGALITTGRWYLLRRAEISLGSKWLKKTVSVLALSAAVLWSCYGFELGRVRESMGLSIQSMPTFQHFPGFVGAFARQCIIKDCLVPAPALLHGVAEAWTLNNGAPSAYLFGQTRNGGWWYFFVAALLVKAPIPFLVLFGVGAWFAIRAARCGKWAAAAPIFAFLAILFITMPVKYNAGVRHVLVLFPLMAVMAGYGGSELMKLSPPRRAWGLASVALLIAWQLFSSFQARHDYISYFNAFAGRSPSPALLNGSDLDCGQDIFRLRSELQRRGVAHFHVAMWSSADMHKMGLPDFEILQPSHPVTGWIAISDRSRLEGEVFHTGYPATSFRWLEKYAPIARVGSSVNLYYIPDTTASARDGRPSS
jgi:hypothetical protein